MRTIVTKTSRYVAVGLIAVIAHSCRFGDNPLIYERELPGELRLTAMFDMTDLAVYEYGNSNALTCCTVVEIGWNDNYVIAKTHPDPWDMPPFDDGPDIIQGELTTSSDTKYFHQRNLVIINGKYELRYPHILVTEDSTSFYKVLPYWAIIDIRDGNAVHFLRSIHEFRKKRAELGVPDTLSFFLRFNDFKEPLNEPDIRYDMKSTVLIRE